MVDLQVNGIIFVLNCEIATLFKFRDKGFITGSLEY